MILYLIFLVAGVSSFKTESVCDDPQALRCKSGECISRYLWCDNFEDCLDGTDERFCNRESETEVEVINVYKSANKTLLRVGRDAEQAVAHAGQYLLLKITEDGWGDFTPRAAVALSFVDKVVPLNTSKKDLMKKHLNVHLMLKLMQTKPGLTSLASYINALYATCQDPRNFQGVDLIALLRSEVDNASMSSLEYPVAFLSLCIADEARGGDLNTLTEMYLRSNRMGVRALAVMAMICVGRKTNREVKTYVDHFFTEYEGLIENVDIYNKALYLQVAIAKGFNVERELRKCQLERYQLADGSFGDMLATYNAIPVLLHSSLLDLRCNLARSEELIVGKKLKSTAGSKLVYSLWITSNRGINTHSMVIKFDGNGTFYDIMRIAATTDPLYRFLYDPTPDGKKIYTLAGIPNNVETGLSWNLYEGDVDSVTVNSEKYLTKITLGVDKIIPRDNNHFVFWYTV